MFKNICRFDDTDINNLIPVSELNIERDSLGRPFNAQVVDQFDSQPFMMAENGFRKNDISILMSAQSEDLKMSILSRLTELEDSGSDLSGLTDPQVCDLIVPRYVQGAAEFRDWVASKDNSSFAKEVDAYRQQLEAKQKEADSKDSISFDSSDDPKSE